MWWVSHYRNHYCLFIVCYKIQFVLYLYRAILCNSDTGWDLCLWLLYIDMYQFIHKCQSQTNSFCGMKTTTHWVKPAIRVPAGFGKKCFHVPWVGHSWHRAFNSRDPLLCVTLYMKSFQVLLITLHKTNNNLWKTVVGRWFSRFHRWKYVIVPWRVCLVHICSWHPIWNLGRTWSPPGQWEYDLHHICPREGGWRICIDNVLIIWNSFLLDFGLKHVKTLQKKKCFFSSERLVMLSCSYNMADHDMGIEYDWITYDMNTAWFSSNFSDVRWPHPKRIQKVPSWELTYPLPTGTFEDVFPFPKVGHVIVTWRVFVV